MSESRAQLEHRNMQQGIEIARLRLMVRLLSQGITYELDDGKVLWRLKAGIEQEDEDYWTTDGGRHRHPSAEAAIRAYMGWCGQPEISNATAAITAMHEIQVAFETEGMCSDEVIDLLNGILERYRMEVLDAG